MPITKFKEELKDLLNNNYFILINSEFITIDTNKEKDSNYYIIKRGLKALIPISDLIHSTDDNTSEYKEIFFFLIFK